ncbi:unnamed protein product [Blepharisma stoltei]|uniref:Ubiquilin n=1 Tax=Blepharisma stoltei TaxID=1481888 RepID=A0AAU9IVT8_9CILI|nr:unnamed protein product [Blepharisma stoltei]
MESESITLNIRITGTSDEFPIVINLTETVSDLKLKCADHLSIDPAPTKLIYKGKVLKDQDTIESLAFDLTQKIYLVKGQSAQSQAPNPSPAPSHISSGAGELTGLLYGLNHFGVMNQATSMMDSLSDLDEISRDTGIQMPDPAFLRQLMSNPATRQMMMTSMQQMMNNPQMRDWVFNSNPQLRQLSERIPGIKDALGSPQVIQQMMSTMERMSVGNTAGPMSGEPGSFPAPGGASPQIESSQPSQPPQQPSASQPQNSQAPQFPMFNPFMMNPMMNPMMQPQNPPPQQAPLPNPPPQAPYPQYPMYNPYGYYGMPYMQPLYNPMQPQFNPFAMQGANPGMAAQNPREIFSAQLQRMKEMGFINEEANIKALQASGGNVELAIERLLNMLG